MNKLNSRIELFKQAQIRKFESVAHKHLEDNIADDLTSWSDYNWRSIEDHFWSELKELQDTPNDPTEMLDLANMLFLLWYKKVYM